MTEQHAEPLEHVLLPFTVGTVALKNRIVCAAHGTGLSRGGTITEDLIAYHAAKARGGVALSVLEPAGVHPSWTGEIDASTDDVIHGYRALTKAVRPYGARVFQQLWAGPGANQNWLSGMSAPRSAGNVPLPLSGFAPHPLSVDEIHAYVTAFAEAARRCREGGIDGTEIHAAHALLVGSFLSPVTNNRTAEYGGSARNRLRFLAEILGAIRETAGPDYPVGVRLSSADFVEGGLRPSGVAGLIGQLSAEHRIDFVNLSSGSNYRAEQIFATAMSPHRYQMPDSVEVTRKTAIPAIVTGRFMALREANEVIRAGDADLVSMVRALIADPYLVRKSVTIGPEHVRPCIGCNQGCVGGVGSLAYKMTCAVNPAAGRERTIDGDDVARAAVRLRLVVVGAGPAGLQAARTAALAGHSVTLIEAAAEVGGQVRYVRSSPLRGETAAIVGYLSRDAARLGVDVKLNHRADIDDLMALGADHVIVATGCSARSDGYQVWRPRTIPGWGLLPALTSWQVLERPAAEFDGKHAVVYDDGGHYEAVDVAEKLLADGASVTFGTRFDSLGKRIEGGAQGWEAIMRPHRRHLMRHPRFRFVTTSFISGVGSRQVVLSDLDADARQSVIDDVDLAVIISPGVADRALAAALRAHDMPCTVIGDAAGPRTIEAALYEGHRAAVGLARSLPPVFPSGHRNPAGRRRKAE